MSDSKLNLFIIGASKAGTTSLWEYLKRRGDVSMGTEKEPCIFSFRNWRDRARDVIGDYDTSKPWRGEASTIYSETHTLPHIAERLHSYNPEARIIYILRNPYDRLLSVWRQTLSTGHHHKEIYASQTDLASIPRMPGSFRKALWTYPPFLQACLYHKHYSAYASVFPPSQIKILFYEDLKEHPLVFFREVHGFLSLGPVYAEETRVWENTGAGKRIQNPAVCGRMAQILNIKSFLHARPGIHQALSRIVQPMTPLHPTLSVTERQRIESFLGEDTRRILETAEKPPDFWGKNTTNPST